MAQKIAIELEFDSTGAVKNLDQVINAIKKIDEEVNTTKKSFSTIRKGLKGIGAAGKAVGKGGLKAVAFGLKGIGKAYKAAGIGLIVTTFGLLFAAFKENQAVLDAFNTVMQTVANIGKQVGDVIANVYKNVAKSTENFDALGKVAKGLVTFALTPIKVAFQAIKGIILGAQLAWEKSFFGGNDETRIAELNTQLNEVGQEFINIKDDVVEASSSIANNFTEAVSEATSIAEEVIEGVKEISIEAALENAKSNIQLKKSADLARVANQGLIEQFDREAEQQRQIRDNDLINIADRIKANEALKGKLEEQKTLMLENVKAIQAAAQAQFDLTGKDEDALALAEAKNEVKAVEAQIEGFMSEQESNRVALLKEKLELGQSETDAIAERQIAQNEFTASQIENEYLRLLAEQDIAQQEKELETQRLTEKRDSYKKGTQAFVDANNELLAFQQANGNKQKDIEKKLAVAKTEIMTNALGNLASIVGKSSKFGKAIAIVQAVRDTFAGANKALSASPPPFNFIAAAAVTAAGIANVKSILSTKDPTPPAGLNASSGGEVATPAIPAPPSFNTVGASDTNQLADVIGSQAQTPVKAFVVSNDVTTAQGLERNIVEGATI
jgi:archaellum component FlaC